MKKINLLTGKGEILRKTILLLICIVTGIMLILYPENAKKGISDGLDMCGGILIPSLFPFLFLSCFIGEYGFFDRDRPVLDRVLLALFGIDVNCAAVFLMSLTGGFPVGGRMTAEMYERGAIDRNTSQRLLLFCVNPGPAFAVTAVGVSMFFSRQAGLIIYSSVALSNVIIAFLTRFIFQKPVKSIKPSCIRTGFSSAFTSSGAKASHSMIDICCYVLVFSCASAMLEALVKNDIFLDFLSAALEVTNGCKMLAEKNNIPLIAGVIAFGGLSVFFQIADSIEKTGLPVKHYFTARTVSAFLSVVICHALMYFFPMTAQTAAAGGKLSVAVSQKGISVSIFMLLTCFVFLIGDFTFKSKRGMLKEREKYDIM